MRLIFTKSISQFQLLYLSFRKRTPKISLTERENGFAPNKAALAGNEGRQGGGRYAKSRFSQSIVDNLIARYAAKLINSLPANRYGHTVVPTRGAKCGVYRRRDRRGGNGPRDTIVSRPPVPPGGWGGGPARGRRSVSRAYFDKSRTAERNCEVSSSDTEVSP